VHPGHARTQISDRDILPRAGMGITINRVWRHDYLAEEGWISLTANPQPQPQRRGEIRVHPIRLDRTPPTFSTTIPVLGTLIRDKCQTAALRAFLDTEGVDADVRADIRALIRECEEQNRHEAIGEAAVKGKEFVTLIPDRPRLKGITEADFKKNIGKWGCHEFIGRSWEPSENCDFLDDYFDHVCMLDRDELFDIAKDLGDRLARRFWDDMDYQERSAWWTYRLGQNATYPDGWSEGSYDEMVERLWNVGKQRVTRPVFEKGVRRHMLIRDTAYVTSPRGGYEALGIFAYANDISKDNMPMDITVPGYRANYEPSQHTWDKTRWNIDRMSSGESWSPYDVHQSFTEAYAKRVAKCEDWPDHCARKHPFKEWEGEGSFNLANSNHFYVWSILEDIIKEARRNMAPIDRDKMARIGKTWLTETYATERPQYIKRLISVDDIAASGHQMADFSRTASAMMPGVAPYAVTLCGRDPKFIDISQPTFDVDTEFRREHALYEMLSGTLKSFYDRDGYGQKYNEDFWNEQGLSMDEVAPLLDEARRILDSNWDAKKSQAVDDTKNEDIWVAPFREWRRQVLEIYIPGKVTVGIEEWNRARMMRDEVLEDIQNIKDEPPTDPEVADRTYFGQGGLKLLREKLTECDAIYNSCITCSFPWSTPDGTSDAPLIMATEGRYNKGRKDRGVEDIQVNPDGSLTPFTPGMG